LTGWLTVAYCASALVSHLITSQAISFQLAVIFRGAALSGLDVCHPVCQQLAEWAVR